MGQQQEQDDNISTVVNVAQVITPVVVNEIIPEKPNESNKKKTLRAILSMGISIALGFLSNSRKH